MNRASVTGPAARGQHERLPHERVQALGEGRQAQFVADGAHGRPLVGANSKSHIDVFSEARASVEQDGLAAMSMKGIPRPRRRSPRRAMKRVKSGGRWEAIDRPRDGAVGRDVLQPIAPELLVQRPGLRPQRREQIERRLVGQVAKCVAPVAGLEFGEAAGGVDHRRTKYSGPSREVLGVPSGCTGRTRTPGR
jgi:hypothetical protein